MTVLLWLFTTVGLAVAVPMAWAQTHIVDVDGYTAMARRAAGDPELQAAVASELATRAMVLINQRGYKVDSSTVHDVAAGYTAGPDFPSQFADANRMAHSWMFTGASAQSEGDQWVIDLSGMLKDSAFASMLADYNVRVPETRAGSGDRDDAKGLAARRITAAGDMGSVGEPSPRRRWPASARC